MARTETLARARLAYERAHVFAALRGLVIATVLVVLALGLHRTTQLTWLVACALAATLAIFGWRGGAFRRGALAGVLAGLPPMIAPTLVFAFTHGGHCPACEMAPTLSCMLTCFGTSSIVGVLVGHAAMKDRVPRRYAAAALATAALTGTLACATVGLGGALGVVVGLVAGGLTGWRAMSTASE
jgi:hypothetical protein